MTDRITTEEAERIADWLERGFPDQDDVARTAAALRALAAERDRLVNEATSLRNEVADLKSNVDMMAEALASLAAERDALREAMETATDCCARATACGRILRDALGENQP